MDLYLNLYINCSKCALRCKRIILVYTHLCVWCRCKVCGAETMFTHAAISQHLKVFHGISFIKYKDEINAFTGLKLGTLAQLQQQLFLT